MSIAALTEGFADALTANQADGSFYADLGGRIYEAKVPPNIDSLPCCVWFCVTNVPDQRLASAQIDAEFQVSLFGAAQKGSQALAGIADKLIALLDRQSLTIQGWNGGQVMSIDWGGVDLDSENSVFANVSRWRVFANK